MEHVLNAQVSQKKGFEFLCVFESNKTKFSQKYTRKKVLIKFGWSYSQLDLMSEVLVFFELIRNRKHATLFWPSDTERRIVIRPSLATSNSSFKYLKSLFVIIGPKYV